MARACAEVALYCCLDRRDFSSFCASPFQCSNSTCKASSDTPATTRNAAPLYELVTVCTCTVRDTGAAVTPGSRLYSTVLYGENLNSAVAQMDPCWDWGNFLYKKREFSIQDIIIYHHISLLYHCVSCVSSSCISYIMSLVDT
jgi:hypothetical protein